VAAQCRPPLPPLGLLAVMLLAATGAGATMAVVRRRRVLATVV
jgi:hypothetical protein